VIHHRGYTGVFEYDQEGYFSGHVVDLKDLIYFKGTSVTELKESLAQAVDSYLDVCLQKGENPDKPFSGNLRVRFQSNLHRRISVAAALHGLSLNRYIVKVLTEAVESYQSTTY